ncbi:MAG: alpha-N-acetylglucosaminidase [Mucinivorans sp.]
MKQFIAFCSLFFAVILAYAQNPVADLVDRIDRGASSKFSFVVGDAQAEQDYFELSSRGGKIVVEGNNWVSVATGLNWYLKYYAGVQITWNNPHANLNIAMPRVKEVERHSTSELMRYYLNYCTISYSMAFWDWPRWQQEIDFMALHGINMPLAVVGTSAVWRNVMLRLGYNHAEVGRFVAGAGFQAWWLMNNLEGWGGVNPNSYYDNQALLEQKIVAEYRRWGIEPVMAGYGGMLPSFAPSDTTVNFDFSIQNPGLWCSYSRPSFLQPSDPRFAQIAQMYYQEQEKLFGKAQYYAIDPFHEGGSTSGVDLRAAGRAIFDAMRLASPSSSWVIQSWQAAPYPALIDDLPRSGVVVLDLSSEERPQWGDPQSEWYRKDGFRGHDWIYCMLLNFGGNVGMYGKMQKVIDGYYAAQQSPFARSMVGVGATMEAIENNPVMYELLYELPWRDAKFTKAEWVNSWVKARYGRVLPETLEAWKILSNTVYDASPLTPREGTPESVFCARPALQVDRVSSWGNTALYYDTKEVERALGLMVSVSEKYRGCNNFEYDIVDLARQALANRANEMLPEMLRAFDRNEGLLFTRLSTRFMQMIALQDSLLSSRSEFMLGGWLAKARQMGSTKAESDLYQWNARTQITTWGSRQAANVGGLRDYAHKEWSGLLKDFYLPRWQYFFDYIAQHRALPIGFDYYDMEQAWTMRGDIYPTRPTNDALQMARQVNKFLKSEEK